MSDKPSAAYSTTINSTQHVSSVNGTSSPTQEQDETILTGETTTSLSNSTDPENS